MFESFDKAIIICSHKIEPLLNTVNQIINEWDIVPVVWS